MSGHHSTNGFVTLSQLDPSLRYYVSQYHPLLFELYNQSYQRYRSLPDEVKPVFAITALLELLEGIMDTPRKRLIDNQHFSAGFQAIHSDTLALLEDELTKTSDPTRFKQLLSAIDETQAYIHKSERELFLLVDTHPEAQLSPYTSDPVPYEDDHGNFLHNLCGEIDSLAAELNSKAESIIALQDRGKKVRSLHSDNIKRERKLANDIQKERQDIGATLLDLHSDVIPHQISFIDACLEDWDNRNPKHTASVNDAIVVANQVKQLYQKAQAMSENLAQTIEKDTTQRGI